MSKEIYGNGVSKFKEAISLLRNAASDSLRGIEESYKEAEGFGDVAAGKYQGDSAQMLLSALEDQGVKDNIDHAFIAELEASKAASEATKKGYIDTNTAFEAIVNGANKDYATKFLPALVTLKESLAEVARLHDGLKLLRVKVNFIEARIKNTEESYELDDWFIDRLAHLSKSGGSTKAHKKHLKGKVKRFLAEEENSDIKSLVDRKKAEKKGAGTDDMSMTSAVSSGLSDGSVLGGKSGVTIKQIAIAATMFDINEHFTKYFGESKGAVFNPDFISQTLGYAPKVKAASGHKRSKSSVPDVVKPAGEDGSIRKLLEDYEEKDDRAVKDSFEGDLSAAQSNIQDIIKLTKVILDMNEDGAVPELPIWFLQSVMEIKQSKSAKALGISSNFKDAVKKANLEGLDKKLAAYKADEESDSPSEKPSRSKKSKAKSKDAAAADDGAETETDVSDVEAVGPATVSMDKLDTVSKVSTTGGKTVNYSPKDLLLAIAINCLNKAHNEVYEDVDPLGENTSKYLVYPNDKYKVEKSNLKAVPKLIASSVKLSTDTDKSEDDASAAPAPAEGDLDSAISAVREKLIAAFDLSKLDDGTLGAALENAFPKGDMGKDEYVAYLKSMFDGIRGQDLDNMLPGSYDVHSGEIEAVEGRFPFEEMQKFAATLEALGVAISHFDSMS